MARTILITKHFPVLDKYGYNSSGEKELLVDYAFNEDTDEPVIVPCQHPETMGGKYDIGIGEWYLP